jgi:hypothetical protein
MLSKARLSESMAIGTQLLNCGGSIYPLALYCLTEASEWAAITVYTVIWQLMVLILARYWFINGFLAAKIYLSRIIAKWVP